MKSLPFIKKNTQVTKQIRCPKCKKIVKVNGHPNQKIIITCPYCQSKGYFVIPSDNKKNENIIDMSIQSVMIGIILFISHFIFIENELFVFLLYLALIPCFLLLKYDGRVIMFFALIILIISMISLSFYNNEVLANQLIIYVYWLLLVGVLCQLIALFRRLKFGNIKRIFG